MPTDITNIKTMYRTASELSARMPTAIAILAFDNEWEGSGVQWLHLVKYKDPDTGEMLGLRYGTNPNQACALYGRKDGIIATMEFLKMGKGGPSLTNVQDISNALQILKYFETPAVAVMKHLNPSGFAAGAGVNELYIKARDCDARSAFGGVAVFNCIVDEPTAQELMKTFIEVVAARDYTENARMILRTAPFGLNKDIRVVKITKDITALPKFEGDIDANKPEYAYKTLIDGSMALELPFMTGVRSADELIVDACATDRKGTAQAERRPSQRELDDLLEAWYVTIPVRSNAVVFYKQHRTIAVGTGQQERIGAVEQAVQKAQQKAAARGEDPAKCLEGAVMASDAFLPSTDWANAIGPLGVDAVVVPAGSLNDAENIRAANEHGMAIAFTRERCFWH